MVSWYNAEEKPTTRAISDSSAVRSPDKKRQTLPVASDEKGTLSCAADDREDRPAWQPSERRKRALDRKKSTPVGIGLFRSSSVF